MDFHAPEAKSTGTQYDYDAVAAPAGEFERATRGYHKDEKRELVLAAIRGSCVDRTERHTMGTRAGCRSGYAVEEPEEGVFEVVKYGPRRQDPVPHGEHRKVIFRADRNDG